MLTSDSDAQTDEGVHIEPDWDLAPQPAPDFVVDQSVSWRMVEAAILTCRWLGLCPTHPPQRYGLCLSHFFMVT